MQKGDAWQQRPPTHPSPHPACIHSCNTSKQGGENPDERGFVLIQGKQTLRADRTGDHLHRIPPASRGWGVCVNNSSTLDPLFPQLLSVNITAPSPLRRPLFLHQMRTDSCGTVGFEVRRDAFNPTRAAASLPLTACGGSEPF